MLWLTAQRSNHADQPIRYFSTSVYWRFEMPILSASRAPTEGAATPRPSHPQSPAPRTTSHRLRLAPGRLLKARPFTRDNHNYRRLRKGASEDSCSTGPGASPPPNRLRNHPHGRTRASTRELRSGVGRRPTMRVGWLPPTLNTLLHAGLGETCRRIRDRPSHCRAVGSVAELLQ